MKNKIYLSLILFTSISFICFAQVEFEENVIIDITWGSNGVMSFKSVDIDNDGDMDVVSANSFDDEITWYENIDGLGTFSYKKVITNNAVNANSVYASDIDGDGDMDVLSTSLDDDKVAWYKNIDGAGTFGLQQIITTDVDGPVYVYSEDMDSDGDMDVLAAIAYENKIIWFENTDGTGTFGTQQIISNDITVPSTVHAGDIDNDGDMDVVAASSLSGGIVWYENIDGACTFGTQQIINDIDNTIRSICIKDIDGDGDLDVLFASQGNDKIAWYENTDGAGTFGGQQIITTFVSMARYAFATDVDNDGDLDVLSASQGDDKIAWYENTDGNGTFGPQQIINDSVEYAFYVHASDIDGDGDIDVLGASHTEAEIGWYENINGAGTFGDQQLITFDTGRKVSVFASDIDGDGDLDVLAASRGTHKVSWHENMDGAGNFSNPIVISTNVQGAHAVHASDIDNDGDIDVLSSSSQGSTNILAWYENTDGLGTFGVQQIINTNNEGTNSVQTSDIDGDGDMDVLSTSGTNDTIFWYENTDGAGNFGSQQIIMNNAYGANSIFACDIDGDGDMDVLSGLSDDNKVVWFENTDGLGSFGTEQVIATNTTNIREVYAYDFGNDGDMDVLLVCFYKIKWYENTDGMGTFEGKGNITSYGDDGFMSSHATDINKDGYLDVLSIDFSEIAWYEYNTDTGYFGEKQVISGNSDGGRCVLSGDIDGDDNIDILSASYFDKKIAWYKNTNSLNVNIHSFHNLSIYPNPTHGIVKFKTQNNIAKIKVFNNLGKLVLKNLNNNSIDISALNQGVYIIKIFDVKGVFYIDKIIKE